MLNKYSLIVFFLFFKEFSLSQYLPENTFQYKIHNLKYNLGYDWENLSSLGSIQYKNYLNDNAFSRNHYLRSLKQAKKYSFYSINNLIFKNNFYFYFDLKYNKYGDSFWENRQNSSSSRNSSSFGIESSGFGFNNSWVTIQIGKGKENWGAGNNIELVLSNSSRNYEYFMLYSDYGKLRVKYFHGFLEKERISEKNRFINGRGLEWSNRENLIISLSEVIIYSGLNKSIQIGYLNPINSHLEVEMNDRIESKGYGSANAIWQASIDYLHKKIIRLSANFLFDEFVLDQVEKDHGKEHGYAFSYKISYNSNLFKNYFSTFYFSNIFIGTPTFRHGYGSNNFVQLGKPLGWENGSDGEDYILGLVFFDNNRLISKFELTHHQSGDENILFRPYDGYKDYLAGKFPSGKVNKLMFLDHKIDYLITNSFNISIKAQYDLNKHTFESLIFSIDLKIQKYKN